MRKIIFVLLLVAALSPAQAQQSSTSSQTSQGMGDIPNMGRAPSAPNEIGRLDLRVVDENGAPVRGAYAELTSIWSKGPDREKCESYGYTDERGVIALPPIHMGTLNLEVKARGYKTQRMPVALNSLADPVRVTLVRNR